MNSDNEEDANDRMIIAYDMYGEDGPDDVEAEAAPQEESGGEAPAADEEHFDITLTASHSYMGGELVRVRGRSVLEAGWRGRVPCLAHAGCVFPGETVPLLLPDARDAAALQRTLAQDRLFALLCPDESGQALSGYGVLCEVFEATPGAGEEAGAGPGASEGREEGAGAARCLARAVHRCKLLEPVHPYSPAYEHYSMRQLEVAVLPELTPAGALPPRHLPDTPLERGRRRQDALLTPWPLFLYDIFDFRRMRDTIKEYFKTLGLERALPGEAVALSFWVARNMPLSARDRLALFSVDDALLRLYMECKLISRKSVVCCAGCGATLARREHVVAMSSDGPHGTFANAHGHRHDLVTTRAASRVARAGAPCSRFSWFPGYAWTVLVCARCEHHVGWRFDALRASLRPARFYGLCRNYAQAHEALPPSDPPSPSPSPPHSAPPSPTPSEPLHIPLLQFRL